ncbi:MAG: cysteine synthase family protein [Chloroflexota bacterium]|nr:cysteine synthase family protein [Chloroflexota bacterium]
MHSSSILHFPAPCLQAPQAAGSALDYIGNTPLFRIRRFEEIHPGVEMYAKAEWFNIGGSVKDRPALRIIEDAERDGRLTPDKTLIDSTSGNTGIAYALICAVKGYDCELVMPENVSEERKRIIAAYGARITYTDPFEGSDGAIRYVRDLMEREPDRYFYADQYSNPSNWRAHYDTTGPEIWEQTEGRITHFVAGLGTSGTIMGTGRRLRELNPGVQIIGVQPDDAFHGLEGLKHMETAITPGIYDERLLDRKLGISTEAGYETARQLAKREGLFAGQSGGAALRGALDVAAEVGRGVVVVLLPDTGSRYVSTSLWKLPTTDPDADERDHTIQ